MTSLERSGEAKRPVTAADWISYDFAVLRVVPHVHLGTFVPVGVIVHARTVEYLDARVLQDARALRSRVPDVDHELLSRYLANCIAVSRGEPSGGVIALAPPSERFHWLTAPRSDVIQSSPIHSGLCHDPAQALNELFEAYIGGDSA